MLPPIAQPKPKLLYWRDGRAFNKRVNVYNADLTRHLFRTHAERAYRMCLAGSAEPSVRPGDSDIWRIVIIRTPGQDPTPGTECPSTANRFTLHPEVLGDRTCWDGNWVYTHRKPTKAELSGTRAVIRDCMR